MMTRRCTAVALLLAAAALGACAQGEGRWIPTWVTAPQLVEPHNLPPPPGLDGLTLRQNLRGSVGGTRVRVRLSNEYGRTPLVIEAATVARSAGADALVPGSARALTFRGEPGVTVPAGAMMLSDEVEFAVPPMADLGVTLRVKDAPDELTGHPGSRTTSFLAAGAPADAARLPDAVRVDRWYLLAAVDVWTDPDAAALAVLGDSITDGRGSTTNGNDRWPDVLSRRLRANPATAKLAVLNQGIGGNRVLGHGLGPSGLSRLDRDVIAQPGVRWLIILEGVNDLGSAVGARARGENPTVAEDLIAAYAQIIRRARDHGIKVYGATIMPFGGFEMYDTPQSEADRQKVNAWIREGGMFDAVIDFDAVARDPANPSRLRAEVDGGDHLHLSAEGYRIIAESIDLRLFSGVRRDR